MLPLAMNGQVRLILVLSLVRSVGGICDDGWLSQGLHCYYISETKTTFQDAEDSCQQSNAHLINPQDPTENNFIFSEAMKNSPESYWIGYQQVAVGNWRWTATGRTGIYFNWDIGEPDSEGKCVRLTPYSGGVWRDYPCYQSLKFVCKKLADCSKPAELQNAVRSFPATPISCNSGKSLCPARSKVVYTCKEKFEFTDKSISKSYVCDLGGIWKPAMSGDEQCVPRRCSQPPQYTHVESNATSKPFFDIGTVIAYTCEYAYWFSAFEATVKYKYLRCFDNQTWAGDDVRNCSRMYCIRPVTSNSVANSSSSDVGAVVRFRCNKGYRFQDKSTSKVFTCGTQTWIPPPEHCLIINCSIYSVANASASTLSVNYGTRVTWTCNAGLQYPDTATRKSMYCTATGHWVPQITEKCQAKRCKKVPPNATELYTHNWNASKTYRYRDELEYKCKDEGWTFPSKNPENVRKVVCGINAEWTPQTVGECTGEPIVVQTEHSTKTPKESKNAQVFGYLGWIVVGGLLFCVILLDVTTIGGHLAMMKNNLCPPSDIERDLSFARKVQQWKKMKKKPRTVIQRTPQTITELQENEMMSKLEKSKLGSKQSLTMSHGSSTHRSTAT